MTPILENDEKSFKECEWLNKKKAIYLNATSCLNDRL